MAGDPDGRLAQAEPDTRVPLTFEKLVAAAAMAALCLITLGNVVARYLTNYSFAFTEEYSIALMVVVTMLGADIAATVASIGMFLLLVVLGGRLVWDEYRFEVTSPGLGEPQWIYTLALPLLSLVVIGRAVGHLIRVARAKRVPRHEPVEPL
jgi:TRAP-type C4-dicarboxylate transport system permease small subunit